MKKKNLRFLTILLLMILVAGCTPKTEKPSAPEIPVSQATESGETVITESPQESAGTSLTAEILKNSAYYAPFFQKAVKLTNGKAVISDNNGSGSITILSQTAIGDLNGDLVMDAAVLLAENGGGSGTFVSLVVLLNQNGELKQIGQIPVDDRPRINSLTISDGNVVLNAVIHGMNDPMSTPSLQEEQIYRLLNGKLTLVSLSSQIQNSGERSINIELPLDGQIITESVEVKGSMPVAPFENNLRFSIYDMDGNSLSESGFMVDAEDVGMPAVFDKTVSLPVLPSGSKVRIELADLSMADGSLIALDSVVVEVR